MITPSRSALIFLFLMFLSALTYAQDTLNRTDDAGRKQGFWRKTSAEGNKVYEGRFLDNVPVGEFRYYYPDGKLKTVSVFSDNGKKTRTVSYFKNGRIMAKGNYIDEKKDSTWQFFSEFDNVLTQTEEYRDGKRNGTSRIYAPSGTLLETMVYKDGLKDGPWEQYYPDGKIKLKAAFSAGENAGDYLAYYPGGQVMTSGQYKNGYRDGTWSYFDEQGKPLKIEVYRGGKLVQVNEFN